MPSKREYRDRKFLFIGIVMGGLLSFIGSFTVGLYFRALDSEYFIDFGVSFIVFLIVIFIFGFLINDMDKKTNK